MTKQRHFRHLGNRNKRLPESLEKRAQVGGGKKMKNSIRSPLVRPPGETFTGQPADVLVQWAANCIEDFKSRGTPSDPAK